MYRVNVIAEHKGGELWVDYTVRTGPLSEVSGECTLLVFAARVSRPAFVRPVNVAREG
jgi:hypothetical protein